MDPSEQLRRLPKIDRLLERPEAEALAARHGRARALAAIRAAVDEARAAVLAGECCPEAGILLERAGERLRAEDRPTLRNVINATGVVLHTNLGRAPLSGKAADAMAAVSRGYCSLEFDLDSGARGSRYLHCRRQLVALSGAEDALAVNNNAAAVMLVLAALCRDREVLVSRGQLVEIGGGFRIPDVMRQSGARLVEVGTTNRTYVRDYEEAITERTAALMVVHRSNFRLTGFTFDPPLGELAALAHGRGLLLLDDLGSGTFLDTARFGLAHEPTVQERVEAGADLVTFSGDKLLGGPQAGCVVGRREPVARLERFPMLRALRLDKAALAGIEATLGHYLREEAEAHLPVWRSMAMTLDEAEARASLWRRELGEGDDRLQRVASASAIGGGSLPGLTLPTRVLSVRLPGPDAAARRLRLGEPPVVCRIEDDRLLFDPRTVGPDEDRDLIAALRRELAGPDPSA